MSLDEYFEPVPVHHPDLGELRREPLPLAGRVALVTGASRRDGIGYAIARRMAAYGASLMVHHYSPHDAAQPWGADDIEAVVSGVREALTAPDAGLADVSADMALPSAATQVMDAALDEFGHVDIVVCNHARSGGDNALEPNSWPTAASVSTPSTPDRFRPGTWIGRCGTSSSRCFRGGGTAIRMIRRG